MPIHQLHKYILIKLDNHLFFLPPAASQPASQPPLLWADIANAVQQELVIYSQTESALLMNATDRLPAWAGSGDGALWTLQMCVHTPGESGRWQNAFALAVPGICLICPLAAHQVPHLEGKTYAKAPFSKARPHEEIKGVVGGKVCVGGGGTQTKRVHSWVHSCVCLCVGVCDCVAEVYSPLTSYLFI